MSEKSTESTKTFENFSKTPNKGTAPTATEMKNKKENPQKEK